MTVVLHLDESQTSAPKRADYGLCAYFCMVALAAGAASYPEGDRVAFIFDERQKVSEELETLRKRLRNSETREIASRIGPAALEDSRVVLPLQAADLLAYIAKGDRGRMWADIEPQIMISREVTWEPNSFSVVHSGREGAWVVEEMDILISCGKWAPKAGRHKKPKT